MTLPICTRCRHTFENFGERDVRVCIDCQPQREQAVQIDVWQFMRSSGVGFKISAGFRLMTRGTT